MTSIRRIVIFEIDTFFTDVTLQILQRVQNQLLASGPTDAGGLVKRAIPEVPNPLDLKELLEKMQRRLG